MKFISLRLKYLHILHLICFNVSSKILICLWKKIFHKKKCFEGNMFGFKFIGKFNFLKLQFRKTFHFDVIEGYKNNFYLCSKNLIYSSKICYLKLLPVDYLELLLKRRVLSWAKTFF